MQVRDKYYYVVIKKHPINKYELLVAYDLDTPIYESFSTDYDLANFKIDFSGRNYSELLLKEVIREISIRNDEYGIFTISNYDDLISRTNLRQLMTRPHKSYDD